MKNLKKKINIILFKQHLISEFPMLWLPLLAIKNINFNQTKFFLFKHGIKYILSLNNCLNLNISNISYLLLKSTAEFLEIFTYYNKVFFGVKFKNLYFSSEVMRMFNYIKFLYLNFFLIHLKSFYFYFLTYLFSIKKKMTLVSDK